MPHRSRCKPLECIPHVSQWSLSALLLNVTPNCGLLSCAATAPVAALFAIMTKIGLYAIIRVFVLIFGSQAGSLRHRLGHAPQSLVDAVTPVGAADFVPAVTEASYADLGRIVVIVPTYNERENLERITARLRAAVPEADLLEHLDLMASLVQRQCRGQSADTGTDDHDFHAATFSLFLNFLTREILTRENQNSFRTL